MKDSLVQSFTSANSLPMKIFRNLDLVHSIVNDKVVLPFHVQFNPTNRCTFEGSNACSFCSCENRPKKAVFPIDEIAVFVDTLKRLGCESMTVTGGGDPLLYPDLVGLAWALRLAGIDVGLVTNGVKLASVGPTFFDIVTWIRISCSDELGKHTNLEKWTSSIRKVALAHKNVDWAFSYVMLKEKNFDFRPEVLRLANELDFTHVRFVNDLLDLPNSFVDPMVTLSCYFEALKIDASRVVYQSRQDYTMGAKQCFISLLKPVVSAKGLLYPCCGVQYALAEPSRSYESSMCMGHWTDLPELIEKQKFFDGSNCVRCYYDNYNDLLGWLLSDYVHERFV